MLSSTRLRLCHELDGEVVINSQLAVRSSRIDDKTFWHVLMANGDLISINELGEVYRLSDRHGTVIKGNIDNLLLDIYRNRVDERLKDLRDRQTKLKRLAKG